MTLEELQNRMTLIGEVCGDLEVDFYKVYNLYLDVLIAIANRQCEGASSRGGFAKEAIQIELSMYDILSTDPNALQAMQNRLAGKQPPPEPGTRTQPAVTPSPRKHGRKSQRSRRRASRHAGSPRNAGNRSPTVEIASF